jgi:hypothetical protein
MGELLVVLDTTGKRLLFAKLDVCDPLGPLGPLG